MTLPNMDSPKEGKGRVEIVCGSMFSGKTEELIRRLEQAKIANENVKVFKPSIDTRYHSKKIVSHSKQSLESISINKSQDIWKWANNVDVIGVDEAQFLDMNLIKVASDLANNGIRIIIAGLDMNFKGEPFGPIPELMASADYVTKLRAICNDCGDLALFSHRINTSEISSVFLGAQEEYIPLCRKCFKEVMKKSKQ